MLSVRLTDGAGLRGMIGVIAIIDVIRAGLTEDLTISVSSVPFEFTIVVKEI